MPKYCVLLPCHEDSNYLRLAVSSILLDIPRHVPIYIVVDKNIKLHEKLMIDYKTESRIKILLCAKSKNVAEVLNFGLSNVTEDYVFRMDSDDIWCQGRYATQKNIADENPQFDVIGGAIDVIDESENYLYSIQRKTEEKFFKNELKYRCVVAHPSVLFKKKSVIDIGGYNTKFTAAEDYDLWSRMRKHFTFSATPNVVIKYRMHEKSQSSVKEIIQKNETKHIIARNFSNILGIQFLLCTDYSHAFTSRKACRVIFFFLRLRRILTIKTLGRDTYLKTTFARGFDSLA